MKASRITIFLLLLCAASLGCTRQKSAFTEADAPYHFNTYPRIESLLETDPAKAMDTLDFLMKASWNSLTPLDRLEMELLTVQAKYKNRCLTEDDFDLEPVATYYDSLALSYPDDADLQYLCAKAYYYKGAQWSVANEDVQAFTQYLNALRVMQKREDWSDNPYAKRFIALIYTRLSEVLYRYGLAEAAFETCHEAAAHYESEVDLAAMKRFEAAIYQSQKQYDKTLACLQEAEQWAPVSEELFQLPIGSKFFELQQYDSAVPHLARAFAYGDYFARVDAASKLAEIFRDKGMADQELAYTRYYVENSLMETRMASRKMEIEYHFDEFRHSQTEPVAPEKNGPSLALLLPLLLLLVIVFMAYIIVRNRKRISHIEDKISTIEQKHEQETADKDHELEQMSRALNDTREQLNAQHIDFDEAWKMFSESAIVTKIKGSVEGKDIMIKSVGVYPKLKLKEMDYIALVREANRCFPDLSSRFLKDHPELNVSDLRHVCLGMLGLNDAEIAVLEGISYSGTNRRTNKILSAMDRGDNLEQAMISYLKMKY